MAMWLILLPLAAALAVWLLPLDRLAASALAVTAGAAEVGLWIATLVRFDLKSTDEQFKASASWFSDLNVDFHVGLYQYSLWLVGMTAVVMAAALAYAAWAGRERPRAYFGLMLFLMSAVVAVFEAQDLLLFYVAWEAMLIPLYFLVGAWGGPGRVAATYKFVVYTIAGSLLMLASIIVYGLQQGSFSLDNGSGSASMWLFLGFAAALAIKAPLFPLHGWLAQAYRESPPEVAAVLSGVVSKTAAYGFLRIGLYHFPQSMLDIRDAVLALAAVGLVYGSVVAFRQPDLRGIVSYSSLAQMGLITMGIFALDLGGINGAVLQMVNHGLVSGAMFLLAGIVERRTGTGDVARLGGMARGRPVLATLLLVTGMIALAVPGSTTFAGEFLILTGVFSAGWAWTLVGAIAIVLAAMYALRFISAVLHDRKGEAVTDGTRDLRLKELSFVLPLVGCLIALSIYPSIVSRWPLISAEGTTACSPLANIYALSPDTCTENPK